jgi:hypothetical protein
MKFVHKVSKNAVYNPVARAVAKAKVKEAMTDHRISLLMLDEGQDCHDEMFASAKAIFIIGHCLEQLGLTESPEYRKIKSALNICVECSENWKWKKEWAITIDNALQISQDQWSKVDPNLLRKAIDLYA